MHGEDASHTWGMRGSRLRWAVQFTRTNGQLVLLVVVLLGLGGGGLAWLMGARGLATISWVATTLLGVAAASWWIYQSILDHRLGGDFVALLALVGTLIVREELAGAVISMMLATGRALEHFASQRAERELRGLLARAPRWARRRQGDTIEKVPVEVVVPGDVLSIGRGDIVPTDGRVMSEKAILDESALTGEAFPVERAEDDLVRSGVVNVGDAFDLHATTTAAQGTYAGIVRLVHEAESQKAPLVRMADRYALWFLVLAVGVAGVAWGVSGELSRAVAVLVVATPCPLILAVPVALVSGLSALARIGVIVKGGGVLEGISRGKTLLFDKTGTLTSGLPELVGVRSAGNYDEQEVLRLSASLDQLSSHPLATAIVRACHGRGLACEMPLQVNETLGRGISGMVGAHHVALGKAEFVGLHPSDPLARTARRQSEFTGALTVFVGVDHRPAGVLFMKDPIRPDAARALRSVRRYGISRTVMVTGDRREVASAIGESIGVDQVLAERSPTEKVEAVRRERENGSVIMVGDGINDAPALAGADVGVAMGARGASASSEAADVVLTVDRLDRLGDAVRIAHRTTRIARESVVIGMVLSGVAMGFAAVGLLPAIWGALLQEGIDVIAILNALRALTPAMERTQLVPTDAAIVRRVREEHATMRSVLDAIDGAARACDGHPTIALSRARQAYEVLIGSVLPHEEAEEAELYPILARLLGGTDRMSTMSRGHLEIAHRIRQLGRFLADVEAEEADPADLVELGRLLYGLHAILELHLIQEEESYLSRIDDSNAVPTTPPPGPTPTSEVGESLHRAAP